LPETGSHALPGWESGEIVDRQKVKRSVANLQGEMFWIIGSDTRREYGEGGGAVLEYSNSRFTVTTVPGYLRKFEERKVKGNHRAQCEAAAIEKRSVYSETRGIPIPRN